MSVRKDRTVSEGESTRCFQPEPQSCQCKSPVRVGWVGTTSYTELKDKPSINGVVIVGDKSGGDYGLANLADIKNGTLILKNSKGQVVGTFSANQANDVEVTVSGRVPEWGEIVPVTGVPRNDLDASTKASLTASDTICEYLKDTPGIVSTNTIGEAVEIVNNLFCLLKA